MDVTGGTVIIDLGLERGEPPTYASSGRRTVPLWFPAALLAALVLMMFGASAAPGRSPLTDVFRLSVGPADTYAMTDDGQLLAQTFGLLTSYDLGSGQMRWQAGQSTPAYRLRLSEGLVLMRPWMVGSAEPSTTAVSVRTGAAQWERDGYVLTVPGSPTLLAVSQVRSLSGTGRRVQGPIDAVDPFTGRTRWTVQVPSTAVLLGVPGAADEGSRMLLVRDDRTMTLHDLDTGAMLAGAPIPAADYNPGNPAVAGGLILLRHPGNQGPELSAYDPVTLKMQWTRPAGNTYEIKTCGVLACLTGPGEVRAVDPATGDLRWSHAGWADVDVSGGMTIAYAGPDHADPIGIIDPGTGRIEVGLDGWSPVPGAVGDHLLVTRSVEAGARTMVAVARPGDPEPRLLAALPTGTGDCQATPSRLVCRSMYGELVVWAYQEG